MDLAEAERLIGANQTYLIRYSWHEDGGFVGDYVPADAPFLCEEEAWSFAKKFAQATKGKYVNIYVVDHHYRPVIGYQARMFNHTESS